MLRLRNIYYMKMGLKNLILQTMPHDYDVEIHGGSSTRGSIILFIINLSYIYLLAYIKKEINNDFLIM